MAKTKTEKALEKRKKGQAVPRHGFGELIEIALAEVTLHPDNPRVGNKKKLRESIKELGFISPIVVQKETGIVMAGNHRVEVARELGYETVPAHVIDCPDRIARKFMLADNKTSDESTYDEEKLAALLTDLIASGDDNALVGTAYGPQEAETIMARAAWQDDEDIINTDTEGESHTGEAKTGVFKLPKPQERHEALEELGRRAIVLSIPIKEKRFVQIQDALKTVRDDFDVRTNEEALVELLRAHGCLSADFLVFDVEEVSASKSKKGKKKGKK